MNRRTEITGDHGTLVIETELIDVTSALPRQDKAWRYTDRAGHPHHWNDGYPTLRQVHSEPYWCGSCADEHTDIHLECPECGEEITPDMTPWNGLPEYIDGLTSARLNGELIDAERAETILREARHP